MSGRDKAANQINDFKASKGESDRLTTGWGNPVDDHTNSMTAGPRGPILLQDTVLVDELARFDRERIPERVVHAKGAGAFGYFEVSSTSLQRSIRGTIFGSFYKGRSGLTFILKFFCGSVT